MASFVDSFPRGEVGHKGLPRTCRPHHTAPRTGTATFQAVTARYDTQIAVYTGNNVAVLTFVAGNDDQAPGNLLSKVSFPDGINARSGNATIQYSLV
jgi:hypothetical protein